MCRQWVIVLVKALSKPTPKVSDLDDSLVWLTYREFVLGVGEYVEADEVVARIETDKVTVDILS